MYESYEFPGETFEFPAELSQEAGEMFEGEAGETASMEAELAQELLEITTEAELDRFLGDLAKSVMKGASSFIKSPVGQALGGVLKKVAKTALPAVGGALGSLVLPGAGTAIGAKLGSLAGGLLEAGEAEMLGEAEAQYEAAQRYVRFAQSAYRTAAAAPRSAPPWSVAKAATTAAARRYAPSLLRNDQSLSRNDQSLSRNGSGPQRGQQMSPWRQRRQQPSYWQAAPVWEPYPVAGWYPTEPGNSYPAAGMDDPSRWYPDGDAGEGPGPTRATPGRPTGAATPGRPTGSPGQPGGRWVRRGQHIVILGA